jgi:predicted acylesterase/phospholipase RssA
MDQKIVPVTPVPEKIPPYIRPISIDSTLLFDGLYNNFPSNVMYEEMYPDFIIGSSVTEKVSIFNFESAQRLIDSGYVATIRKIPFKSVYSKL